ncbi:hypothetical protein PBY51_002305 [Eleginops maclovinus]|uniref:Flavin-containing monooxygenase n=1 Tax=Eleginops maclovinus TaxID=56733 RepID=A0AAN7X9S5_ELEMC|nr:hypothetical protein PBY51_002305 [Eleginops maclovinus]
MLRVAVVGGGAAGLCAARHILSRGKRFAPPVVFELTDNIGGTWCYDERITYDDGRPVHSSMYRDLRTNLPKEVMMFPDFPFDSELCSFLPHHEVQKYLEKYCQSHGIRPHIRFNTVVEKVAPLVLAADDNKEETTWEVTSCDSSGLQKTETFDSVFVCSGHYSVPNIPTVPGIENFKGQVLHSHSYRCADSFSGNTVVVMGAKASGLDISVELAKVGAQVRLSYSGPPLSFPLPDGIQEASLVEAVERDGSIRFQDGSSCPADVLLFCTGYVFSFPFLDAAQLKLQLQDQLLAPLYRHMMPPNFPSLFFIGMCKLICPFPNFHCQVQFALAVLDGSVPLPPAEQMEQEELQEKEQRGVQQRHLMVLQQQQWEYCSMLAAAARFPPLPPAVQSLYKEVWRQRQKHPQNYRRLNYRMIADDRWELAH